MGIVYKAPATADSGTNPVKHGADSYDGTPEFTPLSSRYVET